MKTFKEFESLRDKMTPRSNEEIDKRLKNLPYRDLMNYLMDGVVDDDEERVEMVFRHIKKDFQYCLEMGETAINYGNIRIIKMFLDKGMPKDVLNHLFDYAYERQAYDVSDLIKGYIDTNESVRDLMTPKSKEDIESRLNSLPLVRDRLAMADRLGIKYDIMKNSYSVSANEFLKLSAERHLLDGVKEAVLRGSHRSYALRLCAEHGFYDGVKWLLENGANPYSNDSEAFRIAENNPSIRSLMKQYRKNTVPYNESLRDKMTPLPKDEIRRKILEKPETYLKKYKEFLSREETYDIVGKMNRGERIKAVLFDVPELYSDDDKREAISGLSREVRHEFVLGRFSDLYTEEEQEECWKDLVISVFEKAHKNGSASVNLDWIGNRWTVYSEPFEISEGVYEYKGKKMKIHSYESGGWYEHKLIVI